MLKNIRFKKVFTFLLILYLLFLNIFTTSAKSTKCLDSCVETTKAYLENEPKFETLENYSIKELSFQNLPRELYDSTLLYKQDEKVKAVSISDEDARSLNSFTTLNSDGSKTLYLFNEPIKYIDSNTKTIKFIDNSLNEVDYHYANDKSIAYTNSSNAIHILLPNNIRDGVDLKYKDEKISIFPYTNTNSLAKKKTNEFKGISQDVVEYEKVFSENIHLQYKPISSGLKENIILDKFEGKNVFEFMLKNDKYIPAYTSGESIPFIDSNTGEIVFVVGQIDAQDSYVGEATDGHFTLNNYMTLTKLKDGEYLIKIHVDEEFLRRDTTVYPVIIDPTITIYSGNMLDTTVYSGKPNDQTFYGSSYNIIGNHGSSYGTGIAYIQTNNIQNYKYINPNNVVNAIYHVREASGKTTSMNVSLKDTLETWAQNTITYNNKPDLLSAQSAVTVNKSAWYDFELTELVKNWIKNARNDGGWAQNYGFALVYESGATSSKHFCSANYSGSYTPSLQISYFDDEVRDWGNVTGRGEVATGNEITYSFTVPSMATYTLETLQPNAPHGVVRDTVLKLYNSNHVKIAENDDISSSNRYSRISMSLSAGTYYVKIFEYGDISLNVACYFIMERDNELYNNFSTYANLTYDFIKIGDHDPKYNCLAYALGIEYDNIEPPLGISATTEEMESRGYTKVDSLVDNCIVAYGNELVILHFAKVENGIVTAKLGQIEKVQHSDAWAYYPQSQYGEPVAYYVKN